MEYLVAIVIGYIINGIIFLGVYRKAGKKGFEGFIPVLNEITLLKITDRPLWWLILFLIPVLNLIIFAALLIDLAKYFGKFSFIQHIAAAGFGFIFFPAIGFSANTAYLGPEAYKHNHPNSTLRDWVRTFVLILILSLFLRGNFIGGYSIPTPSCEETLLIGDYILVSKTRSEFHLPMSPLLFPMAYILPLVQGKSVLDYIQLPYYKVPGKSISKTVNNELVVFNFAQMIGQPKSAYIKRCIATPGDTLKIDDRKVYINGKLLPTPEKVQAAYKVYFDNKNENVTDLHSEILEYMQTTGPFGATQATPGPHLLALKKFGIESNPAIGDIRNIEENGPDTLILNILMTSKAAKDILSFPGVKRVAIVTQKPKAFDSSAMMPTERVFPNYPGMNWTKDFYGPIYIPKKGDHIPMTLNNYYIYQKAIREDENNPSLTISGNQVLLDDKPVAKYIMKKNYYFMMGDNRDNSMDSRYIGFIAEEDIIGKPFLIWLSLDPSESFVSEAQVGEDVSGYLKIRVGKKLGLELAAAKVKNGVIF